jgi:hypothetical protein
LPDQLPKREFTDVVDSLFLSINHLNQQTLARFPLGSPGTIVSRPSPPPYNVITSTNSYELEAVAARINLPAKEDYCRRTTGKAPSRAHGNIIEKETKLYQSGNERLKGILTKQMTIAIAAVLRTGALFASLAVTNPLSATKSSPINSEI